jgi:hypothetical protein
VKRGHLPHVIATNVGAGLAPPASAFIGFAVGEHTE